MFARKKLSFDTIKGEWKTILLSSFLHIVIIASITRLPSAPVPVTIEKPQYMELDKLPESLKEFTPNLPKETPVKKTDAKKEVKGGLRPDKVVTPETGKPGGSVSGFNGEGGEALGTKGTGEGAGSSGQGGTGQPGTDVYRVGVEEMPEPYGGVPAIISKIPPATPELSAARGRSIYITAFIDESGIVRKAHVSKGIGNSLDNLAATAVRKTRFKPGKDKGKIVKVQMMLNLVL